MHVARITVGIVFLLLGVVGAVLPILQGWVFFLLALITFFPGHPKVARILDKAEPKFPRVVRGLRKLGIGPDADELARSHARAGQPDEEKSKYNDAPCVKDD